MEGDYLVKFHANGKKNGEGRKFLCPIYFLDFTTNENKYFSKIAKKQNKIRCGWTAEMRNENRQRK